MAKYRVYLKDGKGIFDVEADSIYEDEGKTEFYVSNSNNATALFLSELVYAIIDTDKAKRAFADGGVVSEENIKFPYIINYYTKKEEDDADVSKAEERLKNLFPHSLWEEETPDDMKGQPLKGEEEC